MWAAVGQILSEAIGVALSPLPIIAVILLLSTPRAKVNGISFVVGWIAGLLVLSGIVIWSASGAHDPDSTKSLVMTIIQFALAALMLTLAWKAWRKRATDTGELPAWMDALDRFGPGKSLAIGAGLAAVNLKNTPLTIAAMAKLAQADISTGQEIGAIVIFAVIAASGVAAPVLVFTVGGTRAKDVLDGWRSWLATNNNTIMMILWLVLGTKTLGSALGGL